MAYRKTDKILDGIEARRAKIINAAIDLIGRRGIEALTTADIATKAKVSEGLIYKYFPDKTEVVAAAVARLLAADLDAMRKVASDTSRHALDTLSSTLLNLYNRNHASKPRLVHALAAQHIYRDGIRAELASLIRVTLDLSPKDASLAAAGALGALYGIHGIEGSSKKAVLFALRGIGVKVFA